MIRGLRSLSVAMALSFVRDRTALFFTMVFPLMFLVLFGGIFQFDNGTRYDVLEIGSVPLLDQVPADHRADLAAVLNLERADDRADALDRVRTAAVDAAVEQRGDQLIVHYSATDQVTAGAVTGLFESLVQQGNLVAAGVNTPVYTITAQQVEDESLPPISFVTPGILSWAIATGAMFGSALTLVTLRQKKILRRLRLAPVRISAVISARVGLSLAIALVQFALFVGVARLPFFGLQLSPSWWMAIPLVIVGVLAFLALGMLAGAWAKTAEAASAISNLIVLPMAFLSGAFVPLDSAPAWLRSISEVLPMRHMVDGMQAVMVRGEGPASVLPQLGILAGFAIVIAAVAGYLFRWDDV